MTVRRKKDPAGLLGDHVTVEFGTDVAGDFAALAEIMDATSPARRIDALRMHATLVPVADKLAERLTPRGEADMRLLHDIALAESRALYLAAAPSVIAGKRAKSQRTAAGFSSGEQRQAERQPDWNGWQTEADRIHAENPHLSKSRVCEIVGATFKVTGRAVAKRVSVGTERPRSKT